jgi:hypothetical protein
MITITSEEFDYYYVTKSERGNESIVIKAMDGTLYEFVKREHLPSDKIPISDESLQGDKYHRTDVDLTEPYFITDHFISN